MSLNEKLTKALFESEIDTLKSKLSVVIPDMKMGYYFSSERTCQETGDTVMEFTSQDNPTLEIHIKNNE